MEKIIMNDVVKAILERRSIRKYEDRQITEEELNTILTCAFNAPSGGNGQQWFLSVVQDKAVLDTISKAFGEIPHAFGGSRLAAILRVCFDG